MGSSPTPDLATFLAAHAKPCDPEEELAVEELEICLAPAIECRARVIDQLVVQAPGEFRRLTFTPSLR